MNDSTPKKIEWQASRGIDLVRYPKSYFLKGADLWVNQ